jgi:hypothetical protein
MYKDKVSTKMSKIFFINVWRKSVFDIYFTEFGAALTTVLPVLFKYLTITSIYISIWKFNPTVVDKGNNKIAELRTILQRESQNS